MASPSRWLSLETVVVGLAIIIATMMGAIWYDLRDDIAGIGSSASETAKALFVLTARVETGFAELAGRLDVTNTKLDTLQR